ncbi:hypothetical protein GGX14DRAFT_372415 [Mycena pura]|uniref:CxC2-like cysteine cluster KDZ transposase-associated domain-containing protein n=1 Tax=Mycena pura TaxID=153505 RepID=A0AAD6V203_9AGAR|nr:hypothetical protein GGX14DRAFT_372415 [Mycena pura]
MLAGDAPLSAGFVNLGYFPCSPSDATVVVTTRVLEVYRVAALRCPRLAIQPWVKSLCDIHGVPFRPYLSTQFSIAFDLYLATRAIVDARVKVLLDRDSPNWRLKNACPACFYKLEGEPPLPLPFLSTKDGNNSLKRWNRRERDEGGVAGASKERADDRQVPGDYYLSRDKVDVWAKESLGDLLKGFEWEPDAGGCSDRWQNMREEITSKAWGMYDETGIFLSLCRHGFVLVVADMVQSGELGKYGFAVTHHLIDVLCDIAVDPSFTVSEGYDIGCEFGERINAHPVLGPFARHHGHRSLVGAFHGHGHCRLCQLTNLATYVPGVGLDDLEYCETFFSKSNALAASTRYASRFHRQQTIATYLHHTDIYDTYQSLSLLLINKYKRALEVKNTEPALLQAMQDLGVYDMATFDAWLAREKEVLVGLKREPVEETLAMEYYQKLVNLDAAKIRLDNVLGAGSVTAADAHQNYEAQVKATRRVEAQRRHAIDQHANAQLLVNDLEVRMSIGVRWTPDCAEWKEAATMVKRRRYQRALDHLQGLIIARMFELTKMNMSGTGYKLRKHIAKALQARSCAVRTALTNYNAAAARLSPPRDPLNWEQKVDYAFLSDFDLLRDGREDIREEPWTKPAGRIAMDMHFKIRRAGEEIFRLNLEIPRFLTYIRDEEDFLHHAELRVREEVGEAMAHQVAIYRWRQGRFNDQHRYRLYRLRKLPGFTGSLEPGTAVNKERLVPAGTDAAPERAPSSPPPPDSDSDSEDSEDEEEILAEQYALMRVTEDSEGAGAGEADATEA